MKDILLITGGSSGLGLEIVKKALDNGLFVCNIGRNKEKMVELDRVFKENYKGFVGDITNQAFISETILEVSKLGEIKYLINNAQKACFKSLVSMESSDIDESLKGLKGMILCTKEVLKVKNEQNLKIVNILSSAALKGNANEALYCSIKWGERGFTESLKAKYKGSSVKIVGVYPGGMNTDFWEDNRDYVSLEKQSNFMNASDVANVIFENIFSNLSLNVSDIVIERS